MIVVAFDIGLTGAVAAIDTVDGKVSVVDLPVIESAAGNRLNGLQLIRILRDLVPADRASLLVAEDVRPRPSGNGGRAGNTMYSQGSLMRSRGAIEATVDIFGGAIEWAQPATWKRAYALIGRDKDVGRETAIRLFPQMQVALKRKKDHNRADALLIARWAHMNLLQRLS